MKGRGGGGGLDKKGDREILKVLILLVPRPEGRGQFPLLFNSKLKLKLRRISAKSPAKFQREKNPVFL